MQRNIKIILSVIWAMAASSVMADTNAMLETSSSNNDVTAVNRAGNGRAQLVIQRKNTDLFTIADTPEGIIPKLQGAYMQDDKIAVIVDWDFYFRYQLYCLKNGQWVREMDEQFSSMELVRRQRLILVEVPDLAHVRLTFSNKGDNAVLRKKGIVQSDDRREMFEFSRDGMVKKNGEQYQSKYNEGLD